jgi:hypothetical protein
MRLLQRTCTCSGSTYYIEGFCNECRDRKCISPDGASIDLGFSQHHRSLVQQESQLIEQAMIPDIGVSSGPFFGHVFSRLQVNVVVPATIQTKLMVNIPLINLNRSIVISSLNSLQPSLTIVRASGFQMLVAFPVHR